MRHVAEKETCCHHSSQHDPFVHAVLNPHGDSCSTVRMLACRAWSVCVLCCVGRVKAIHLDNQVSGFLVEGNTFENYSYALDINGGTGHVIRDNHFGSCPADTCSTVIR